MAESPALAENIAKSDANIGRRMSEVGVALLGKTNPVPAPQGLLDDVFDAREVSGRVCEAAVARNEWDFDIDQIRRMQFVPKNDLRKLRKALGVQRTSISAEASMTTI